MLDLSPVVLRLRTRCVSMKDVDFAFNQTLAVEDIKRFPSMYVLQNSLTAGMPKVATQVHLQLITEMFDVLTFLDSTGVSIASAKRSEVLKDVAKANTDELELALIGWTWSPYIQPLRIVRAQLVDLDKGRMILRHSFATEFEFRKTTTD